MNPLELRDIHLPDAVSAWPPAIGWWLIGLLMIAIIIFICLWRKRTPKINVNALIIEQFEAIRSQYDINQDKNQLAQQLAQLIRQLLIQVLGRKQGAHLQGDQWLQAIHQLNDKKTLSSQTIQTLTEGVYQAEVIVDTDELLTNIETWLRTLNKVVR